MISFNLNDWNKVVGTPPGTQGWWIHNIYEDHQYTLHILPGYYIAWEGYIEYEREGDPEIKLLSFRNKQLSTLIAQLEKRFKQLINENHGGDAEGITKEN